MSDGTPHAPAAADADDMSHGIADASAAPDANDTSGGTAHASASADANDKSGGTAHASSSADTNDMSHGIADASAAPDAISVLQADHRRVEVWFQDFQNATSLSREQDLARDICNAIRVHVELDQQLFYPAFLESTGDEYRFGSAMAEHEAISGLIDEIDHSGPTEDMFFAKIHVLCDMFESHVKQEEKAHGVFERVQEAKVDLIRLGRQIVADRRRLLQSADSNESAP